MSYRFQKIYYTILFTLFLACSPDTDLVSYSFVPDTLEIETNTGLRFDNSTIEDGSMFNIKTAHTGKYTLEVLDITNSLVTKNTFTANEGDNVFTFYTRALETGDYTFKFYDNQKNLIQSQKLFIK